MSRQSARDEAQRRFGDERRWRKELERIDRGTHRSRRRAEAVARIGDDLRYALRRMRRSPALAVGIILTLALGIGANATMFSIVDRLLLRPPAHVADPDGVRRLMVEREMLGVRSQSNTIAFPDYEDFERAKSFASVAAWASQRLTVGSGLDAERREAILASGEYFSLLGVKPALGRFFGESDDRREAAPVAVIGYGYWQKEYGGDAGVLGRTIDFGRGPVPIVGVAPRGFTGLGLGAVDVWLPVRPVAAQLRGRELLESRGWTWIQAMGRLAPGAAIEQAAAEATVLHRQGRSEDIQGGRYDPRVTIAAAHLIAARGPLASQESKVAVWLAGVSLLVLLIACANVANLLLARAVRERREIGVRLALGVSRGRLLAQVMTESLMLAVLGGVVAVLVTRWGGEALRRLLLPGVVELADPALDRRVLLFMLGVALVTGLIAGLIPAVQSARPGIVHSLKSGSRGATPPGSRTRTALTVLQATLSVVLLVGAGLFVRSLHQVRSLDLGLRLDGVVLAAPIYGAELTKEEKTTFHLRAVERLRAIPGVEAAAAARGSPFYMSFAVTLEVPGVDSLPRTTTGGPYVYAVTPDYFNVVGMRLVRGRDLSAEDRVGAPLVAVVNETMARLLWPGEDPLGKCLIINEKTAPCSEVVGVVADARRDELLEDATMQYYVPLEQNILQSPPEGILIRTNPRVSDALASVLQRELLSAEPRLRYVEVLPLADMMAWQTRSWTLGAAMFTVFGLLALVVAGVGLYSVLAFAVAQRLQELGIRAALGATRERLLGMVLGQGVRLVALGVGIGLGIALVAAPRIAPLLFEVSPRDPLVLAVVAVALLLAGVAAAGVPAWRATRVDPSTALRSD